MSLPVMSRAEPDHAERQAVVCVVRFGLFIAFRQRTNRPRDNQAIANSISKGDMRSAAIGVSFLVPLASARKRGHAGFCLLVLGSSFYAMGEG